MGFGKTIAWEAGVDSFRGWEQSYFEFQGLEVEVASA